MDVPFISSGAISRAQYALVRKVESAESVQLADQHIVAEVQSIRRRLAQSTPSLKQCKEDLIILLYCSTSIAALSLNLEFALPYAVNLAEAGRVVQDKKIGYLFCTEVMLPDHELQLMLVNTIRKDLEGPSIPRICLALDALITSCTVEVVPAVQARLHDLLSHNSLHVRRRAILACRAVSRHDPEIMERVAAVLFKRLQDPQSAVASMALVAVSDLVKVHPSFRDGVRKAVVSILLSVGQDISTNPNHPLALHTLQVLRTVELPKENFHIILKIIRSASRSHVYSRLYGAFLLISDLPWDTLSVAQTSSRVSPIDAIRHLLTSRHVNEQYLFLSCLECLDPRLWAGTTADLPAILEGWEVERIMQLLESPDSLIRKKTLRILHRIDVNIVETYYSQSVQYFPRTSSLKDKNDWSARRLEVIEIQCSEDGEGYAQKLKEILGIIEDSPLDGTRPVLEKVVEVVLHHVRNSPAAFRIGCVTTLLTSLAELDTAVGSTFMVILCALATEFCGLVSIPPMDIIHGFSSRLFLYSPAVQDACLLSMLRIVADLDEVPSDVLEVVARLGDSAGRHIRRRCNQFTSLCGQKQVLVTIIAKAHSLTLPGFLEALDTQDPKHSESTNDLSSPKAPPSRSGNLSPSLSAVSSSKLRYAAYEPPKPAARLHPSNTRRSSSRSTDAGQERDWGDSRSARTSEEKRLVEELSKTTTAGDLALAAGNIELETMNKVHQATESPASHSMGNVILDDLISRADLIVLDSPFISKAPESLASQDIGSDFEEVWNALENSSSRGWCESSTDVVVRRLQGLTLDMRVISADRPPFEGDLKVLMVDGMTTPGRTAIRLRDSEEDGCLWRLRCSDDELRTRIKRLL